MEFRIASHILTFQAVLGSHSKSRCLVYTILSDVWIYKSFEFLRGTKGFSCDSPCKCLGYILQTDVGLFKILSSRGFIFFHTLNLPYAEVWFTLFFSSFSIYPLVSYFSYCYSPSGVSLSLSIKRLDSYTPSI